MLHVAALLLKANTSSHALDDEEIKEVIQTYIIQYLL